MENLYSISEEAIAIGANSYDETTGFLFVSATDTLYVWDTASTSTILCVANFNALDAEVRALPVVDSKARLLAVGTGARDIALWDLDQVVQRTTLEEFFPGRHLAFFDQCIITVDGSGNLSRWDSARGDKLQHRVVPAPDCIALHEPLRLLAIAGHFGKLWVIDPSTLAVLEQYAPLDQALPNALERGFSAISWSMQADAIALASWDWSKASGRLSILDRPRGEVRSPWPDRSSRMIDVKPLGDHHWLSLSENCVLSIWSAASTTPVAELRSHPSVLAKATGMTLVGTRAYVSHTDGTLGNVPLRG